MKPARSKKYLAFLRTMPCAVCGVRKGVEAAHGPVAGMGMKGSDFDAVPLCPGCHRTGRMAQHVIGWERFAEYWELDLNLIRQDLRARFERTRRIGCPPAVYPSTPVNASVGALTIWSADENVYEKEVGDREGGTEQ